MEYGFSEERLKKLKGIIFRFGGQLVKTERRDRIKDLDSLPSPALHLLPEIAKYYCPPVHTLKRLPATNMVASRGCSGNCLFCAREVYRSELSCYSASRVMDILNDQGKRNRTLRFFMMGNPGETRQTLCETIDLALKLNISDFHVSFTTLFPGSELYATYQNYGTFENDWRKMHGWTPLFIPYGLTKEELKYFSNRLYVRFYFRLKIVWHYIKKINSLKNLRLYIVGFLGLVHYLKLKEKS